MFKYRQSLLPVDPDQQKKTLYEDYFAKFARATELFTDEIRKRTLIILNHVSSSIHFNYHIFIDPFAQISVIKIETYPSDRLVKVLLKIDRRKIYLRRAYDFIQKERVSLCNNY